MIETGQGNVKVRLGLDKVETVRRKDRKASWLNSGFSIGMCRYDKFISAGAKKVLKFYYTNHIIY